MNFPKETLAGMYNTDLPFLESSMIPVIKRKFNYIPGLTQDPPRVLTEPMNAYLRERKSEGGVYNDMAKIMASGAVDSLWEDGDYNDIVKGLDADYQFNQETLNAQFKPSPVFQFMRADAERYTDETIRDFFQTQYEDKEEQKRAFLMDYGVSPAEAEQMIRRQKVEVAEAALKEFVANKRPMRPQGLRINSIVNNFMRNDVPMIEETNFFSPDGNLQPGITGLSMGSRADRRPATIRGSRMAVRARAEESIRDQAIDGLPVIPLEQMEREMRMLERSDMLEKGLAKVKADRKAELKRKGELFALGLQVKEGKKSAAAMRDVMEQTAQIAFARERAVGGDKAGVIKRFMEERPEVKTKGSAERILKSVAQARDMRVGAGRPMGSGSTSKAFIEGLERSQAAQPRLTSFFGRAERGAGEK
jgi:hypothetical protein